VVVQQPAHAEQKAEAEKKWAEMQACGEKAVRVIPSIRGTGLQTGGAIREGCFTGLETGATELKNGSHIHDLGHVAVVC